MEVGEYLALTNKVVSGFTISGSNDQSERKPPSINFLSPIGYIGNTIGIEQLAIIVSITDTFGVDL